jgi:integrase
MMYSIHHLPATLKQESISGSDDITFSTLLAENDQDVKTVQSLIRHANSGITTHIYTDAVSSKKRRAQSKVVEMILPTERATPVSAGVA